MGVAGRHLMHLNLLVKQTRQNAKSRRDTQFNYLSMLAFESNDVIVVGQYPHNLYILSSSKANFQRIVLLDNYDVCVEYDVL